MPANNDRESGVGLHLVSLDARHRVTPIVLALFCGGRERQLVASSEAVFTQIFRFYFLFIH